jgi:hypothetical protein
MKIENTINAIGKKKSWFPVEKAARSEFMA